ncbi:MAG: ankyrin repeat domain-containing protein [Candidatus Micrarchaeales archaeon]
MTKLFVTKKSILEKLNEKIQDYLLDIYHSRNKRWCWFYNFIAVNIMYPKTKDKDMIVSAVVYENTKRVEKFLKKGVSPDITDYDGNTLAMIAVDKDNIEILQLLHKYNANFNKRNKNGESILEKAKTFEVFKYLVDNGAEVNSEILYRIAKRVRTEIRIAESFFITSDYDFRLKEFRYALEHAVDIKKVDMSEENIEMLFTIARFGDLNMFKYALEHGITPKDKNIDLGDIINHAVEEGNIKMLKYAVEKLGLDINTKTTDDDNLYIEAPLRCVPKKVWENGEPRPTNEIYIPEVYGIRGSSFLITAYSNKHRNIVDYLLEKGADVNVSCHEGTTLLTLTLLAGDFEFAKELIEKYNAKVDHKTLFLATQLKAEFVIPNDKKEEAIRDTARYIVEIERKQKVDEAEKEINTALSDNRVYQKFMELLEKELNKKGLSVNSEGVAKFGSLDLYGVFLDALRAVDSSNADKYKLTEARREALDGIVEDLLIKEKVVRAKKSLQA